MYKQFHSQYKKLFKKTSIGLNRILKLKFDVIQKIENQKNIINEKEYRKI